MAEEDGNNDPGSFTEGRGSGHREYWIHSRKAVDFVQNLIICFFCFFLCLLGELFAFFAFAIFAKAKKANDSPSMHEKKQKKQMI